MHNLTSSPDTPNVRAFFTISLHYFDIMYMINAYHLLPHKQMATHVETAAKNAKYTGKKHHHGRTFYCWEYGYSIEVSRTGKWWINVPGEDPMSAMSAPHAYDCARYLAKAQGVELEAIQEIEGLKVQRKKTHNLFMHRRHEYANEIGVDAYTKF